MNTSLACFIPIFEAFRKYGFEFEFTGKNLNDKERAHYFADTKKRKKSKQRVEYIIIIACILLFHSL